LMNELYPSKKWMKTIAKTRTIHSTKDKRTEVLWTNYDPNEKPTQQMRLMEYR